MTKKYFNMEIIFSFLITVLMIEIGTGNLHNLNILKLDLKGIIKPLALIVWMD